MIRLPAIHTRFGNLDLLGKKLLCGTNSLEVKKSDDKIASKRQCFLHLGTLLPVKPVLRIAVRAVSCARVRRRLSLGASSAKAQFFFTITTSLSDKTFVNFHFCCEIKSALQLVLGILSHCVLKSKWLSMDWKNLSKEFLTYFEATGDFWEFCYWIANLKIVQFYYTWL